jgi:hypothetical protein
MAPLQGTKTKGFNEFRPDSFYAAGAAGALALLGQTFLTNEEALVGATSGLLAGGGARVLQNYIQHRKLPREKHIIVYALAAASASGVVAYWMRGAGNLEIALGVAAASYAGTLAAQLYINPHAER